MKNLNTFIDELNTADSFNAILIDYENKNGIAISKDIKDINFFKEASPYKFYLFNDSIMIYGVKIDGNEYFIEEVKKDSFSDSAKEEIMFIDPKEITKVSGHSLERKIRFRRGLAGEVEKIQFIGLEG